MLLGVEWLKNGAHKGHNFVHDAHAGRSTQRERERERF